MALFVHAFEASEHFFIEIMGMSVEWRPDPDNVYLTSGNDNLALHRSASENETGKLDHIGFFINKIEDVDPWFEYLQASGVDMLNEPRTHRDGARSFYCKDPSGVKVQVIYHPPIANAELKLDPIG
ncbi:MAG: catechol 2,3-dioxygenase-like lactoylglutathione lyase family enzyme [Candidatus Azotimanducaceae bacterium]